MVLLSVCAAGMGGETGPVMFSCVCFVVVVVVVIATTTTASTAISALGPKVFDTLLLPRCPKHIARLERIIDTTSSSLQRFEAYHCKRALMVATSARSTPTNA